MSKKGNILVVDDNAAIRSTLSLLLPAHFEKVITLPSPKDLHTTLRMNPDLDLVLLDMNFTSGVNTGNEGIYWLGEIKKMRPSISVVLFTAYGDIPLAVNAIKEGATDFIEKPWNNEKLILTLQNGVQLARSAQRIKDLKAAKAPQSQMYWGVSPAMLALREMIEKVAPTDANILIVGENGTGKEMLTREIHSLSNRNSEILVNVDMGSLTETLFESELFGHAKGAFTDAKSEKSGKFEVASGGTLFLDEIGNIPLNLQSKLLTALQSRSVVRVGENVSRSVDIRLITATNSNLEKMIGEGSFREDLYYRINTFILRLPPLRERGDDVLEFANIFLARFAKKYNKPCESFSPAAQTKLKEHPWPGNIRELEHAIERSVIICSNGTVLPEDILLSKTQSGPCAEFSLKGQTLEQIERTMIENTMRECEGNISEVAAALGITRQTLYNKLKRYDL